MRKRYTEKCSILSMVLLVLLFITGWSCRAQNNNSYDLPYDIGHPKVFPLKHELREISDLTYNSTRNSVYAVCDNSGDIFEISLKNTDDVKHWKFHKKKDFEGITSDGQHLFVLNSNGDIYEVDCQEGDKIKTRKYTFPTGKTNEFEILYWDPHRNRVILICKNCPQDSKKVVSAFSFNPETHQFEADPFEIRTKKIAAYFGEKNIRFKPSAASVHPLTGELYIVSSINKALVIADEQGRVRHTVELDPGLFKQPEGLTFAPNGDMYISNESHKEGPATLLYFPYQPNK